MLKELKISNFRIFDAEVTVRFRPITVLIGRNNSGKSSIIKFLLMLQQSLYLIGQNLLQPEGPKVQFGDFHSLKNSITENDELKFRLTVSNDFSIGDAVFGYLKSRGDQYDENRVSYAMYATIPYGENDLSMEHGGALVCGDEDILVCNNPALNSGGRLLDIVARQPDALDQPEKQEFNAQMNVKDVLLQNITAIEHLSASRKEFGKVIDASAPPLGSVGQKGQYALSQMQRMLDEDNANGGHQFVLPHLRNVAGIEDVRFKKATEHLSLCLAKSKATGAVVPINDYGFGVSQCLPIFVQGAMMKMNSGMFLMVEQPEAQLHPTAQLDMGNFFRDLWKTRGVGSIIETHSDNILLRLRSLVATDQLSADDVSVAYFHLDEKHGSVVRNLDINQDGTMEKGLPMEFFGENINDVLKIGARK